MVIVKLSVRMRKNRPFCVLRLPSNRQIATYFYSVLMKISTKYVYAAIMIKCKIFPSHQLVDGKGDTLTYRKAMEGKSILANKKI